MLAHHKPSIFFINETWLNSTVEDNELNSDNYVFFRKDRSNGKGGGVLVYIRNCIPCIRRYDLESNDLSFNEIMVIDITLFNSKFIFLLAYRPPNATHVFYDNLNIVLNNIKQAGHSNVTIVGDLNLPMGLFYQ